MEKDYTKYAVSDFLTDDEFVGQHLKPTSLSVNFWTKWQAHHLDTAYTEAVSILESIRLGLSSYENNEITEDTKSFIFNKIKETNRKKNIFQFSKYPTHWLGVAAAVILVCLTVFLTHKTSSYNSNLAELKQDVIEKENQHREAILVHLPDGSAVKLAPKSKISYPANFDKDKRVVILLGEATFDIAKDVSRPFLVYANEVTTKVLGTRFNVKAYESMKDIVVSVEEGKVSVYKNKKKTIHENELTGVILLPNQQAIFDRESDQYNKKLIQKPTIINANPISFSFNETPIEEVFKRIEIAYGIDIEFDEGLLHGCQVTGTFDNESLFQKLDIITKIIGGSYEVVEGKILINSVGCRE
ncbi:FecR domain-containing protein [Arcicella sp. LKC2W]|uniref:FecR family protein n=1 Tax=Arcicella sp. LKC2W TaxID=2984198 RepID=UPI002B21E3CD|nr:FecR domain-containing protein [Arcicella sp. LKC2W]MEA5460824.1 FecR domain-containing protein [Arcicella sp. LKC2W]